MRLASTSTARWRMTEASKSKNPSHKVEKQPAGGVFWKVQGWGRARLNTCWSLRGLVPLGASWTRAIQLLRMPAGLAGTQNLLVNSPLFFKSRANSGSLKTKKEGPRGLGTGTLAWPWGRGHSSVLSGLSRLWGAFVDPENQTGFRAGGGAPFVPHRSSVPPNAPRFWRPCGFDTNLLCFGNVGDEESRQPRLPACCSVPGWDRLWCRRGLLSPRRFTFKHFSAQQMSSWLNCSGAVALLMC